MTGATRNHRLIAFTARPLLAGRLTNPVVLEVGGRRIGVISVVAADTDVTLIPGPTVVFQDEIESLTADVAALEAEGDTMIIGLTHLGITRDLEPAAAVEGIDAIVGGHSHTLMAEGVDGAMADPAMVGGVSVVTAFAYATCLGHLALTFGAAAIAEDPVIAARVADWRARWRR